MKNKIFFKPLAGGNVGHQQHASWKSRYSELKQKEDYFALSMSYQILVRIKQYHVTYRNPPRSLELFHLQNGKQII